MQTVIEIAAEYLDWAKSVGWSILPVRPDKIPASGYSWGHKEYQPHDWMLSDGTLAGLGVLLGPKSGWTFEIDIDTDDRDDIKKVLDLWFEFGLITIGKRFPNGRVQPSRLVGRFEEPPPDEWLCGEGKAGKMSASFMEIDFGGGETEKKREDGKRIAGLEFRFGGFNADGITPMQLFSLFYGRNGDAQVEFMSELPMKYEDVPLVKFEDVEWKWQETLTECNMRQTFKVDASTKSGRYDLEQLSLKRQKENYWLDFCNVAQRLFSENYKVGGGNRCMFCPEHNRAAMHVWGNNRAACFHDGGSCPVGIVPRGGQQIGVSEIVGKAMKLSFPAPEERSGWEWQGVPFLKTHWSDNDFQEVENALMLESITLQPLEVSVSRFLAGKKVISEETAESLMRMEV